MSVVKFASLCDHCEKRSEEYTRWPRCLECGAEVCEGCMVTAFLAVDSFAVRTIREQMDLEKITLAPVDVLAAFLIRDMRLNAVRSAEVREIAS
jgi:hypothetical protein